MKSSIFKNISVKNTGLSGVLLSRVILSGVLLLGGIQAMSAMGEKAVMNVVNADSEVENKDTIVVKSEAELDVKPEAELDVKPEAELDVKPKAELSRYERNVLKYRKHWDVLMPTHGVLQTCGNMGIISMGVGWDYGKRRQWETHLMLGFIPRFDSEESKVTLTIKENFIPWRKDIGKGWWFEPLECSVYFNTVFGHDFWTKQPTKYESGYYPFSTRVRPNIALGERFKFDIPHNRRKRVKSITVFYELGTNDIYFMRFYRNGSAGFWDVFGLSFGAKFQFL